MPTTYSTITGRIFEFMPSRCCATADTTSVNTNNGAIALSAPTNSEPNRLPADATTLLPPAKRTSKPSATAPKKAKVICEAKPHLGKSRFSSKDIFLSFHLRKGSEP